MTHTPVVVDHHDPLLAAAIVELQRASYPTEAELIGFEGIPPLQETAEQVAALDLVILAVVECGTLVGIVGYRRGGDVVDVDRLAVHPHDFRRGLARLLMQAVHTEESDARRFEISTGVRNTPALRLYQSLGYVAIGDVEVAPGVWVRRMVRFTVTPPAEQSPGHDQRSALGLRIPGWPSVHRLWGD